MFFVLSKEKNSPFLMFVLVFLSLESLKKYDEALEAYIPVLMAQARIYWEREHYTMVEKIFRQSAEFCSEHETWKLNVAHVFFMQENKFKYTFFKVNLIFSHFYKFDCLPSFLSYNFT